MTPGGEAPVDLPVPGLHQVDNFLAAAAIGTAIGVAPADCAEAARGLRAGRASWGAAAARLGRAALRRLVQRESLLDARRAGDARGLPAARRIAVLGDMLELGADEERWHREAGAAAVGPGRSADLRGTARPRAGGGGRRRRVPGGPDPPGRLRGGSGRRAPRACSSEGDVVLFKASRGIGLDRAVALLDGSGVARHAVLAALPAGVAVSRVQRVPLHHVPHRDVRGHGASRRAHAGARDDRWLRKSQIRQSIRQEGPKSHLAKAGTPTMGGLLILLAVSTATLLWMDLSNRFVWIALGTLLALGAVGFADDYVKVAQEAEPRPERPRETAPAVPGGARGRRGRSPSGRATAPSPPSSRSRF